MSVILENYDRKCKVTQGKIKRVYLMPFLTYSRALIKDFQMSLTEYPAGQLIYQFEVDGSYTQSSNSDQGAIFFDQTVIIKLSEVYDTLDIHDLLNTDYRIIVETYNDQLIMFGVRNGLTAKTTNSSGSSKNEFNGFDVTFTGKEEKSALLISSLEDFGFIVYDPDGFLNYDLNFDLS